MTLALVFTALCVIGFRMPVKAVPMRLKVSSAALIGLVGFQICVGWYNVAHAIPVPTSSLHTATAATIVGVMTWTVMKAMTTVEKTPSLSSELALGE